MATDNEHGQEIIFSCYAWQLSDIIQLNKTNSACAKSNIWVKADFPWLWATDT